MFEIFLRENPASNQKTAGFSLPSETRTQHSMNPMDLQDCPWCGERENLQEKPVLIFCGLGESVEFQEVIKSQHLSKETQSQIPWKPRWFWVLAVFDPIWNHHKSQNFGLFINPEGWESCKSNYFPAQPDSLPLPNPETKLV